MSTNADVAGLLEEMADHLEARDIDFKPNAYRRAAGQIRGHTVDIETLYSEGGTDALEEIDEVGEAIASKTAEYLETGTIEELEDLRVELPVEMEAITAVEGVGPKTAKALYDALGVETLDDLEAAAEAGDIQSVSGFGAKTEHNILENIPFARTARARSLLGEARPIADTVISFFEDIEAATAVDVAGSIRRWRPTIGDIDVLVASSDAKSVVDAFTAWDRIEEVIEAGESKVSVRAEELRVDLRIVTPTEFGAALQYFTGSKDHNVAVRNRAIEMDLKVNEYGVFDVSDVADPSAGQRVGDRIAGATEEEVYAALDMAWMPPELRENRGEVDAATSGALPALLNGEDINGDLHLHTTWSDGHESIESMVEAAAAFGHDYITITDHATGPGMVGGVGVSDADLARQLAEIRSVNETAPIEVFAGVEANIGMDGAISVDDAVLADLDCVIASPHSGLNEDGTDRLVAAINHPEVDIIGHPTGRLLNQRAGHEIDINRVTDAAAATDTALEINANPNRLDLRSSYVKTAIESNVLLSINTDAHRPESYGNVRYGVHTARRGWVEPADVLNCRSVDGVQTFLEL